MIEDEILELVQRNMRQLFLKKDDIEKTLSFPIETLFDSQKNMDLAKKEMGKKDSKFKKLVFSYLSRFVTETRCDFDGLSKFLRHNYDVIERHLGKDFSSHLDLLVKIYSIVKKQKRFDDTYRAEPTTRGLLKVLPT